MPLWTKSFPDMTADETGGPDAFGLSVSQASAGHPWNYAQIVNDEGEMEDVSFFNRPNLNLHTSLHMP